MRSQLDRSEDSRRTIGTTNDTQCTSLLRSESHQHSYQQHREDTQLCSSTEYRKTQIAEHRSEVRHGTHTHKDNRRQESRLNQHVVDEVHQSQVVCNLMQRHFPDVLHHAIHHDHSVFISLNHSHISTGEIGNEHTESNGHQQQRFVVLLYAQIQQNESNGIHHQKRRVGNDIAERRHIVEFCKYFFHHSLSYLH